MHVVVVEFSIKQAHVAAFREAVSLQARTSLEEEAGCHVFDVCFDPGDDSVVLLYEKYATSADFAAHLESAHFRRFDATTAAWIERKSVRAWQVAVS